MHRASWWQPLHKHARRGGWRARVPKHRESPTWCVTVERVKAKCVARATVAWAGLETERAPHGVAHRAGDIPRSVTSFLALRPDAARTVRDNPDVQKTKVAMGTKHPTNRVGCGRLPGFDPVAEQFWRARAGVKQPLVGSTSRAREGEQQPGNAAADAAHDRTSTVSNPDRRSSCAFTATMIVLSDMSTAPTAGLSTTPQCSRTPAASGIATML